MTVASAQAFENARAILHGKRDRPSVADKAYNVYLVIMVGLVLVFPWVRAIVLALGLPEAISAQSGSSAFTPAILAAVSFAVVLLGGIRGPIVPVQPYLDLVVASPIRQRRALAASARGAVALAAGIGCLIATAAILIRLLAGPIHWAGAGVFFVASVLASMQLAMLWLIGQLQTPLRRWVLIGLGALTLALALLPFTGSDFVRWIGPWGWVVETWQAVGNGATFETWLALVLLLATTPGLLVIPTLLDRLRREDLAAQAQRWNAVGSLAETGDVKAAANRLKTLPRRGRTWRVWFAKHPIVAIAQRDVVGIRRFPGRALLWAFATVAAGAAIAATLANEAAGLWPYLLPVALYFAVGGWLEGMRMFAATLGASSPYGMSARRQTLAHLIVPGVIACVLATIGAVIGCLLTTGTISLAALQWVACLALFALVLQVFSALKGPVPVDLRAPILTPAGDVSMIRVGLYLADAVVLMLLAGGWLTGAMAGETLPQHTAFAWLAGAIACAVLLADSRLSKQTRPAA